MRNVLRVVTSNGAMTSDVDTKKTGKVCEMGSQVTFPSTSRKQREAVVRGGLCEKDSQ